MLNGEDNPKRTVLQTQSNDVIDQFSPKVNDCHGKVRTRQDRRSCKEDKAAVKQFVTHEWFKIVAETMDSLLHTFHHNSQDSIWSVGYIVFEKMMLKCYEKTSFARYWTRTSRNFTIQNPLPLYCQNSY